MQLALSSFQVYLVLNSLETYTGTRPILNEANAISSHKIDFRSKNLICVKKQLGQHCENRDISTYFRK